MVLLSQTSTRWSYDTDFAVPFQPFVAKTHGPIWPSWIIHKSRKDRNNFIHVWGLDLLKEKIGKSRKEQIYTQTTHVWAIHIYMLFWIYCFELQSGLEAGPKTCFTHTSVWSFLEYHIYKKWKTVKNINLPKSFSVFLFNYFFLGEKISANGTIFNEIFEHVHPVISFLWFPGLKK